MNQSKISVRYARAIFELAEEKGLLEKVYADFRVVRETLASLPEFKEVMASPIVKKSDKINLFVNSFGGKIDDLSLNFLKFLVDKNREIYVVDILRNFETSYRRKNNCKEVVITTFPVCAATGIYEAHLFLFVLTVAVVLVLKFIFRKMTQKQGLFGYIFMASSLVKMALCVVFLIPIIRSDADYRIAYVVQFFVLYFAYLVMEVVLVAKLLKASQES